jgi:hypothetical protein
MKHPDGKNVQYDSVDFEKHSMAKEDFNELRSSGQN